MQGKQQDKIYLRARSLLANDWDVVGFIFSSAFSSSKWAKLSALANIELNESELFFDAFCFY